MKRIWCHNASIASRLARALWIPDAPLLHRTIVNVHSFWYSNFHSKRKVSDRFTMHFGSFVIKILWLNYRIEGHLYTSQIREYPPPGLIRKCLLYCVICSFSKDFDTCKTGSMKWPCILYHKYWNKFSRTVVFDQDFC